MNTYQEQTELADVIWGVKWIKVQGATANLNSD
jgi:hypothetical protein